MDDETINVAQGNVAQAGADVDIAKARLSSTFGTVKQRLNPRALAHETVDQLKQKAAQTAQASVDAVKSRPSTAIGVAAAAVLLLFRKPIFGAMRRLTKEKSDGE
jgi:ElaB/YqjD/DUF883 family membrane-anchored ribosome-binding protein